MARVVVEVMPKPEILDPQGKAVTGALERLGRLALRLGEALLGRLELALGAPRLGEQRLTA